MATSGAHASRRWDPDGSGNAGGLPMRPPTPAVPRPSPLQDRPARTPDRAPSAVIPATCSVPAISRTAGAATGSEYSTGSLVGCALSDPVADDRRRILFERRASLGHRLAARAGGDRVACDARAALVAFDLVHEEAVL